MSSAGYHLVTGGSGYFGSLLVRNLRQRHYKVRVFDIHDAADRPADVDFFQGDIRDAAAVARACQDVVVAHHNVAMVPLAKDKSAFWAVNRDGTRNLLTACLDAGVRKVVNVSSSAVFGVPPRNPVDEATAPHPGEEYGRAKLAGEATCHDFVRRGLDVTIIRPRTILGHGRLGIMQILFDWIQHGKKIPVLGRGDNLYQFVHADDLASACIAAAARKGSAVYNIGAERFGTMRETLEGLIAHAGTDSRVFGLPMAPTVAAMNLASRIGASPLGPYHALMYGRSMYFDLTKPKAELDWAPRYSNVEMFCQSYDWYLLHWREVLGGEAGSFHRSAVKQGLLRLAYLLL